jgi:peptidyl-prolyl cis-trans isomerase C
LKLPLIVIFFIGLLNGFIVAFDDNINSLNTIIASVNGVAIKKKDFKWAFSSEEQWLVSKGSILNEEETAQLKKASFDNIINRELLYQESVRQHIEISDLKVEEEYGKLKASMPSDVDLINIKKELDLSEQEIKSEFKKSFAIEELIARSLEGRRAITEKEMKDFYESHPDKFTVQGPVRASHILIKVDQKTDAAKKSEARKKAESLLARIKKGEDFAELAKKYSDCSSSTKGGDLGYVRIGQTTGPFEKAVFALNPGETSGIVETIFGYHIIKAFDRKPAKKFAYDDIKVSLKEFLINEKSKSKELEYISRLKKNSKIEVFVDPLKIN